MTWALAGRLLLWGLAIAGVATAAWTAVRTYNGAIERAAEWKARAGQERLAAEGWKAAAAFWQAEKARSDQVITQRDRRLVVIGQEKARLTDALEQAKRTDPEVADWAARPLPAFVVEQLRGVAADPGTSPDRPGTHPGKSPFWHPGPGLARNDKR